MDNKSVRIVRLDIDEMDDFSGVDAIALVEEPAIESNFIYFSKQEQNKEIFESYSDYPDSVSNNAKRGIELNEKVNNKCATQVGKVRAQQLANKEKVSVETIKRMYSYLSRAEEYYDESDTTACGTISYLLWGGLSGKRWAESKLKELDLFEGSIDVSSLAPYINEPSGSIIPKDIFVTPSAGESEAEFIGRCVPVLIKEGYDNDQALAICYSDWRDRYDEVNLQVEKYIEELFDFLGYVDGLPVYSTSEEAMEVAEIAGCGRTYHEHVVGDITLYMPCESHDPEYDELLQDAHDEWMRGRTKSFEDLSQDEWDMMKDYLESVAEDVVFSQDTYSIKKSGVKASRSIRNSTSFLDTPTTKIRYKYVGPISSNSREFCRFLVENFTNRGKVFRKEDINNMSLSGVNKGLGPNGIDQYNIFLYRGGNNCKHNWEEVKFSLVDGQWKDTTMSVRTVADPITPRDPQSPLESVIGPLGIGAQFSKEDFSEQQVVAGPFMIPDKLIYRFDNQGEYFVYFPKDAIKKIAYKYMEKKYIDSANIEHDDTDPLRDVFVVESWLVTDPKRDKSSIYSNGETYPEGTWYGMMKIKNKEIWDEYVKTGRVRGFSVEGYFIDQLLNKKYQ